VEREAVRSGKKSPSRNKKQADSQTKCSKRKPKGALTIAPAKRGGQMGKSILKTEGKRTKLSTGVRKGGGAITCPTRTRPLGRKGRNKVKRLCDKEL